MLHLLEYCIFADEIVFKIFVCILFILSSLKIEVICVSFYFYWTLSGLYVDFMLKIGVYLNSYTTVNFLKTSSDTLDKDFTFPFLLNRQKKIVG